MAQAVVEEFTDVGQPCNGRTHYGRAVHEARSLSRARKGDTTCGESSFREVR